MSTDVIKYSIIASDCKSYALVHGWKKRYDVETGELRSLSSITFGVDQRQWMKETWGLFDRAFSSWNNMKRQLDEVR